MLDYEPSHNNLLNLGITNSPPPRSLHPPSQLVPQTLQSSNSHPLGAVPKDPDPKHPGTKLRASVEKSLDLVK
jgi:hypothetical protein